MSKQQSPGSDAALEKCRFIDLAYEVHCKYLDADSATSGPIEDYIAAALQSEYERGARRADELERTIQEKDAEIARLTEELEEARSKSPNRYQFGAKAKLDAARSQQSADGGKS